jgi:GH18 family chitinase
MRKKSILLVVVLSLLVSALMAGEPNPDFRVVGYYSLRSAMNGFHKFPFKLVTHVNLYFVNPDSLGNFSQDFSALKPFIDKAHKKNVKVLFSIGGGSEHPYYHRLLLDENRPGLVEKLVSLALQYNLDGIDVDLEGNDIDKNYESFVVELAGSLRSHQKLTTSAVAVYYKDQFTDRVLEQYDFVNVMVYDRTGPWRPEKPGQHSSYADAVDDLEYFGKERNLPAGKMVLGVPFYGYAFGPELTSPAKSMNFGQIVSSFHGSEMVDEWKMDGGYIMYYNGVPTIKKKTELAVEKASGIMIWQLGGDAKGSKSLLKTINCTAHKKK